MNLLDMIRDEAIERANDHANQEWKSLARSAVVFLAETGRPFTTDDVWDLLDALPVKTHEPRALGAIMQKAAKDGLIRSSGPYVKSRRPECHRRPVAVWEAV